MNSLNRQTQFQQEGRKRVVCYNCYRYISTFRLDEPKERVVRCSKCKTSNFVSPAAPGIMNGQTGIFFGPNQSMFTPVEENILKDILGKPVLIKN